MNIKIKIGIAVLLLAVAAGALTYHFYRQHQQKAPEKAYYSFIAAVAGKDWETVWNAMSRESRETYEKEVFVPFRRGFEGTPADKTAKVHPQLGVSVENVLAMKPYDLFRLSMEKTALRDDMMKELAPEKYRIQSAVIVNDRATLIMTGDGRKITMIKENGTWRISLFK